MLLLYLIEKFARQDLANAGVLILKSVQRQRDKPEETAIAADSSDKTY